MVEKNGRMTAIWILAGWIFILSTSAFAYTWGAVSENRRNISIVKDCLATDLKEILQRVTRIEAKIE